MTKLRFGALGMALIAFIAFSFVMPRDAAACKWYDASCKAREVAHRARQAAERAKHAAEAAARRARQAAERARRAGDHERKELERKAKEAAQAAKKAAEEAEHRAELAAKRAAEAVKKALLEAKEFEVALAKAIGMAGSEMGKLQSQCKNALLNMRHFSLPVRTHTEEMGVEGTRGFSIGFVCSVAGELKKIKAAIDIIKDVAENFQHEPCSHIRNPEARLMCAAGEELWNGGRAAVADIRCLVGAAHRGVLLKGLSGGSAVQQGVAIGEASYFIATTVAGYKIKKAYKGTDKEGMVKAILLVRAALGGASMARSGHEGIRKEFKNVPECRGRI